MEDAAGFQVLLLEVLFLPSSEERLLPLEGFVTVVSMALVVGLGGRLPLGTADDDPPPETILELDPCLPALPIALKLLLDVGGLLRRNKPPIMPRAPPPTLF